MAELSLFIEGQAVVGAGKFPEMPELFILVVRIEDELARRLLPFLRMTSHATSVQDGFHISEVLDVVDLIL